MEIELSWYEVFIAAMIGVRRNIEARRKGLPDKHGFDGKTDWTVHIEGAAGEMAYAKARDKYWSGSINTFKNGGDVGKVQIRTRSQFDYDLIVRDGDRDEDIFVLVVGKCPKFRIVGWERGRDAKRQEYMKTYGNRPPAYFVPQSKLRRFAVCPGKMGGRIIDTTDNSMGN